MKFPSILANQLTPDLWIVFSWSCTQLMMISSRFCCLSLFMRMSCENVCSVCHVSDIAQPCSGRSAGLSKKKISLPECKCFDMSSAKAIWATQCTENKQDATPPLDISASHLLGNCQYCQFFMPSLSQSLFDCCTHLKGNSIPAFYCSRETERREAICFQLSRVL